MRLNRFHLPMLVTIAACGAALLYGPIPQFANYHDFADQRSLFGIPHAQDVLSNVGFALVALWGWWKLRSRHHYVSIMHGWPGYRLLLVGLFLTAFGSSYYHLAPDNARLVWDRLPIALACAGLLAGVWGDAHRRSSQGMTAVLALVAVASVGWWYATELAGAGDLRPYVLLQGLPIVLIPLWLWLHDMPRGDRFAFGAALLLYVIAKFAELYDHQIAAMLGATTGHTLKHLLATAAAGIIVARLVQRTETSQSNNNIIREESC
jgi:hypothetical protein